MYIFVDRPRIFGLHIKGQDCLWNISKMEGKTIKEEIPDKDYSLVSTNETSRRGKGAPNKDRGRTPEPEEGRSERSPLATSNGAPSPPNATLDSLTPPLSSATGASDILSFTGGTRAIQPPLHKLRRFLSTLVQFGTDISPETGERVRNLVHNLVTATLSVEEFQAALQDATNYPLRASVPPFLRALVPHAQRDLLAQARHAKQTPIQFVRCHENVVMETGVGTGGTVGSAGGVAGDAADIFGPPHDIATASNPAKRRTSDGFYDATAPQTNGSQHPPVPGDPMDYAPPPKRHHPALLLNPSPLLFPLQTHSHLFDYTHPYHPGFHGGTSQAELLGSFSDRVRETGPLSVRDIGSVPSFSMEQRGLSAPGSAGSNIGNGGGSANMKNDDEWRNINTMLNCILSMVEKTKRALAILQQRGTGGLEPGLPPNDPGEMKRMANDMVAAAVRQAEDRVAEVRRRAEDALNQVKRQAVLELQRAVTAAEGKALEMVAAERVKVERLVEAAASATVARRSAPDATNAVDGSTSTSPVASSASTPAPLASSQNSCWNCGRKAQETCSGCNAARYCGSFCQHKDWENHHQICGREQKPGSGLMTSSPPAQSAAAKPQTRATSPTQHLADARLSSLAALSGVERLLTAAGQDRVLPLALAATSVANSDRLNLAISTGQSLMAVGSKK